MRVLYLVDANPDYLSDDLLYGLRSVLGADVVDYPRKDVLYNTSSLRSVAHQLYGRGFHCFGLSDIPVDRSDILQRVTGGDFDVIINSSGWRVRCPLHPQLVVIDGEDHGRYARRYIGKVALYCKRELKDSRAGVAPLHFALPDFLHDDRRLPRVKQFHASFSLNSAGRHLLAARFPPASFETWEDYRRDISQSWFGISPKGAGYDCQRHYEIFGQAVLCVFLDAGAPQRLHESFVDGHNCLTFTNAEELSEKMARCSTPERLIEQARQDLVAHHLASKRAEELLAAVATARMARRKLGWLERLEWRYWLTRRAPAHGKLRDAYGTRVGPQ